MELICSQLHIDNTGVLVLVIILFFYLQDCAFISFFFSLLESILQLFQLLAAEQFAFFSLLSILHFFSYLQIY